MEEKKKEVKQAEEKIPKTALGHRLCHHRVDPDPFCHEPDLHPKPCLPRASEPDGRGHPPDVPQSGGCDRQPLGRGGCAV